MKYQEQITKNNLRKIRKQTGLTQLRVASLLGWKNSDRLSHWEKGTSLPNIINLFRLSDLYQVEPSELYPEIIKKAGEENKAVLANWRHLNG